MDIQPTLEGQVDAGQQTAPEAVTEQSATPADGQAAPAQAQPSWNAQEYALNYRGQTILPKDKQFLLNLAQQGYGYTQAMEKLNKEKQELEQMRTQYGQYENLDKFFQSNPSFQQKVLDLHKQYQSGQIQDNNGDIPPQINQVQTKIEKMYQDILHKQEDQRLKDEIQQLRTNHKDDQWDVDDGSGTLVQKLIKHTIDKNFPTLEAAYRDFMWDSLNARAKAEALKQAQVQQQQNLKAGKVVGAGAPAPVAQKSGYDPKMSYDDLVKQSVKELS